MAKVTGGKVLTFSRIAWEKMWGMTLRAKGEFQAFGLMSETDPSEVIDFFVVEQSCTSASTNVVPEALHQLFLDKRDEGISMDRWRVWMHSHKDMKAFFSGTDEDNVERYASEKALWSVVTNQADALRVSRGSSPIEMYIRVDCFDPDNPKDQSSPQRFTIEGCSWRVQQPKLVADSWYAEQLGKITDAGPEVLVISDWKAMNQRYARNGPTQAAPTKEEAGKAAQTSGKVYQSYPGLAELHALQESLPMQPAVPGYKDRQDRGWALGVGRDDDDDWRFDGAPDEDLDGRLLLSHPALEGMYLHGVIEGQEAQMLSEEYSASLIDEKDLVDYLTAAWESVDPRDTLGYQIGLALEGYHPDDYDVLCGDDDDLKGAVC